MIPLAFWSSSPERLRRHTGARVVGRWDHEDLRVHYISLYHISNDVDVYRRTRVTHVRYMHLIAYMHMQIFLMFWIIRGLLTSLIFICVGVCIPNIGMGSSEVNEFSSSDWVFVGRCYWDSENLATGLWRFLPFSIYTEDVTFPCVVTALNSL